ncbi:hypothetical protein [Xylanimonas protaetiae]|uniref:hypothetical protein n=1 Tax=Xylanimonas protaetiae TaxID=2509457 RepID=UPI0013EAEF2D|nr:hypothetical protein [Xylanimonas protaetiae]
MARAAVRRVRARRAVLGTTGVLATGALALTLTLAPWVGRPGPVGPGTDATTSASPTASASTDPAPTGVAGTPSSADPAPRHLPTGGSELPELPGLRHGAVPVSHSEYHLRGGLTYTLPPGGWEIVAGDGSDASFLDGSTWDVSPITQEPPGAVYPDDWTPAPMAGSGARIDAYPAEDAVSWQVPARDSGAWTADVPGADLVVVTRGPSQAPGREVWTVRVRAGDAGWLFTLDFTADDVGAGLAADFVGNLWVAVDDRAPAWFEPTYEDVTLDGLAHGVTPAGWREVTAGDLTFAVPAGWTGGPTEPGEGSLAEEVVQLDGPVAAAGFQVADGSTVDLHWRVLAQYWGKGGSLWDADPRAQALDVPGADLAQATSSAGPFWGDETISSYGSTIVVHAAHRGGRLSLTIDVPHDDAGLATLRGIVGSMRFR